VSKPLAPGDLIVDGRFFRRIQNRKVRFDTATHRPEIGAFEPRPVDNGELSVHIEALVSQAQVHAVMAANPLLQYFGLCVLDVAAVLDELAGRSQLIFQPDATDPHLGHAHAVLPNLSDEALQAVLLRHAIVLDEPQHVR